MAGSHMGEASWDWLGDLKMEPPRFRIGEASSESMPAVVSAGYRVLGEPSYSHLVDPYDPNLRTRSQPYDPPYLPSYPISSVLSGSFQINPISGTDYPSFALPPCSSGNCPPLLPRLPPFPLTGPKILPFSFKPPPLPPLQLLKDRHLNAPPQEGQADRVMSGDSVPKICLICNREGNHIMQHCPFMVIATHLDVFKANPSHSIIYKYYFAKYQDMGIHGTGKGWYLPPGEDDVWSAKEAMSLHIDGIHLVRVSNVQTNDPEEIYKTFSQIGLVSHVVLFLHQHLGFVGFVDEHDADKAISKLNSSGCGLVEWATCSPW